MRRRPLQTHNGCNRGRTPPPGASVEGLARGAPATSDVTVSALLWRYGVVAVTTLCRAMNDARSEG